MAEGTTGRRVSTRPGPKRARRAAGPRWLTSTDVALGRVIVRGNSLIYTLAINPGFNDPNTIDPARGVDMPRMEPENGDSGLPIEASRGQAAIVERVAFQHVPDASGLRAWLGAQMARRGGAGGLTDTLLALAPIPAGKERRTYRASLLRALERSGPASKAQRGQEHGQLRLPDYRARVGRLAFTETRNRVLLGVTGHWDLTGGGESREETFRRFNTNLEPGDPTQADIDRLARRVVESADGAGFIALVVQVANLVTQPYGADLLVLHGLHIELQAPRRAGRATVRASARR